MAQLIRSRFSLIDKKYGTPSVLTMLGVPFKKKKRCSFWMANEDALEYIFNDFGKAKRQFMGRLRPDRTTAEEFTRFNLMFDLVERSFRRRINLPGSVIARSEEQERAKIGIAARRNHGRPIQIRIKRTEAERREYERKRHLKYRLSHKEQVRASQRIWRRNKRLSDPEWAKRENDKQNSRRRKRRERQRAAALKEAA